MTLQELIDNAVAVPEDYWWDNPFTDLRPAIANWQAEAPPLNENQLTDLMEELHKHRKVNKVFRQDGTYALLYRDNTKGFIKLIIRGE